MPDDYLQPPRSLRDVQPLLDEITAALAAGEYQRGYDLLFRGVDYDGEPILLIDKLEGWHEHDWLAQQLALLLEHGEDNPLDAKAISAVLSRLGGAYRSLGQHQTEDAHYQTALEYYQRSLEIAERLNDTYQRGECQHGMAGANTGLKQYELALDQAYAALAAFQQGAHRIREARTLNTIAFVYRNQTDLPTTLDFHHRAMTILQEVSSRWGQVDTLADIALAYYHSGSYAPSLEHYEQALAAYRQLGSPMDKAATLHWIGILHFSMKAPQQALEYYQQALALREQLDDIRGQSHSCNNIGWQYQQLKEYEQALGYFRRSISLCERSGERTFLATPVFNAGLAEVGLNHPEQAIEHYRRAADLYEERGKRQAKATALLNIGQLERKLNRHGRSLVACQEALTLFQQLELPFKEGTALHWIGLAHGSLGNWQQAIGYYEQSLAIRQRVGDHSGEAYSLNNIGYEYLRHANPALALEYYQQAVPIFHRLHDAFEATTLRYTANAYRDLGDNQAALDYAHRAVVVAQLHEDRTREAEALSEVATTYQQMNDAMEALAAWERMIEIYHQLGNQKKAVEAMRTIATLCADAPTLPLYHATLRCYKQLVQRQPSIRPLDTFELVRKIARAGFQLGEANSALDVCRDVANIARQQGAVWEQARMLNQLASSLDEAKQYTLAADYHLEAAAAYASVAATQPQLVYNQGAALTSAGDSCVKRGKRGYAQAIANYQQATALYSEQDNAYYHASEALRKIGAVYGRMKQREQALDYYRQALYARLPHSASGTRPLERTIANLEATITGQPARPSFLLDDIVGIGPKRKLALLRQFGSVNQIVAASDEQVLQVKGMNRTALVALRQGLGGLLASLCILVCSMLQ